MIPPIYVEPNDPDFLRILNSRFAMLSETGAPAQSVEAGDVSGLSGTHDQRLATYPATTVPSGATFYETDRTMLYVAGQIGGARYWKRIAGTMRDTLANIPTDLGAHDAGFLFHATNYLRTWRWTGSAWEYNDGERLPREITWYPGTLPTGWALCDGSSVTVTNAAAVTGSFPTPNLMGAFPKGGVYTGAVVPAVAPGLTGDTADESAHTHSINHDHPAANSGAPAGIVEVQSGTGATVAHATHLHATDLPALPGNSSAGTAHKHGKGTLTVDAAGEPTKVLILPIVKL